MCINLLINYTQINYVRLASYISFDLEHVFKKSIFQNILASQNYN